MQCFQQHQNHIQEGFPATAIETSQAAAVCLDCIKANISTALLERERTEEAALALVEISRAPKEQATQTDDPGKSWNS